MKYMKYYVDLEKGFFFSQMILHFYIFYILWFYIYIIHFDYKLVTLNI